jgi:hypothetical protein
LGQIGNTATVAPSAVDWSPADNPYAIGVSEAQWWQRTVELGVRRLADPDDHRIAWFSSRQIDARQIVVALTQVLNAEQLEQVALQNLDIEQTVRDVLTQARDRFEAALPGIKHMRLDRSARSACRSTSSTVQLLRMASLNRSKKRG